MANKHPLNQKEMLSQYRAVYEGYNAQCDTLSEQHRGGQYATGYRCLINFCTAYHKGKTKGFAFETSYAMMAQDWGLSLSAKSIKRHLLRMSEEIQTLRKARHEPMALPMFSRLEEAGRGGYLHVKLWLRPSFIVFEQQELQALHAAQYPMPSIYSPPIAVSTIDREEQPDKHPKAIIRQQIAERLGKKYKIA